MNDSSPFARPAPGFVPAGQPDGAVRETVDGARVGDVKTCWGVLVELLKINPGWKHLDGTVTMQDGTTPPDTRDRVIIGAGTTYALGATGGSKTFNTPSSTLHFDDADTGLEAPIAAHAITQPVFDGPTAHGITQPVFDAPAAHAITQPVVNSHGGTQAEFTSTPGSGVWINTYASSAAAVAAQAHSLGTNVALTNNHATPNRSVDVSLSNNAPHATPNRSVNVALDHNHDQPDVTIADKTLYGTDEATPSLPPYAAFYRLIKVY